jgi:putative MATE family efflux protein
LHSVLIKVDGLQGGPKAVFIEKYFNLNYCQEISRILSNGANNTRLAASQDHGVLAILDAKRYFAQNKTIMISSAEVKKTDYTEGSVTGSILKMGLPSMFGFMSQNIYGLVNMFWVSHLPQSESAVAGITFFNNLAWFLGTFNHLIGPGSVAVISQRYGEKDYDRAEKAIKETLLLKLFFGAIFGIIGFLFLPQMMHLIGARDEAFSLGVQYGKVIIVGLPINYAIWTIFTALRGTANPQKAMALMLGFSALNMVLDPILIFGWLGLPAFGMIGAAYASIITFATIFAIGVWIFFSGRANVRIHWRSKEKMALGSMWILVRIGIPSWLAEMSFSLSRLAITPMIAGFGTAVVAAYGVANQVMGLGFTLLVGVGLGLSALIGHTVGAGKIERAKKTGDKSIAMAVGIMSLFGLIIFAFAPRVLGIFFSNAETIANGVGLLRIMALSLPFMGALMTIEFIHTGVGLNTPAMVVNIISSWLLQVAPIYIIVKFFGGGESAVWWIMTLAGAASACMFYAYYRRGRWLTARV